MGLRRIYGTDSWTLKDGNDDILTVQETANEKVVTVSLKGSLRSDTEHYFKDELIALSTVGMDIVLDFKELTYVANACQIALLSVQQRMDDMGRGTLTIKNVPANILKDFEKTNLHELLMIE